MYVGGPRCGTFDLMEMKEMRGRDCLTMTLPGTDDAHGWLALFPRANLHGRGVGAKKERLWGIFGPV